MGATRGLFPVIPPLLNFSFEKKRQLLRGLNHEFTLLFISGLVSGTCFSDAFCPLNLGLNLRLAQSLSLFLLILFLLFWIVFGITFFPFYDTLFMINAGPAILFWLLILDFVFPTSGAKGEMGQIGRAHV